MRSVVRRVFFNFEKEEKWLNNMAAKGFNLIDYTIARYVFQEGAPGEYIYRIELLENLPSHPESKAYIKFMEEAGIECVATYFRWVYFRKKAKEGPFDLYSDYDSRIKHYKRIATLTGVVGFVNLSAAMLNASIGISIGVERGDYTNLFMSLISWTVTIILASMFISYIKKIRNMKKEKDIYE